MDLRRQWISQTVEEVQKIVHHLTTEISYQDVRFQAVLYSDMYNENIKVRGSLGSKCPPSEPGNGGGWSQHVSGTRTTKITNKIS